MKILIFGASGMLGNAMLRFLSLRKDLDVVGTIRSQSNKLLSKNPEGLKLIGGVNVDNYDSLVALVSDVRPNVIINCIGLVKQISDSENPLHAIPINSLLPHRLAALSKVLNAKLIHFSTDCVFSGEVGGYTEACLPNPVDLYGRSKLLGEVECGNAITLRTSIIGHELSGSQSLVNWFLSQSGPVNGFRRAIYTGLPTVELSRVVSDFILPSLNSLSGVYHVASEKINKYELLQLISSIYEKRIEIIPFDDYIIDRSLDATKFNSITGYSPPSWPKLIENMHSFQ